MIPSTQHCTIGNHQPIPQPKPVHSPDICPSPDDPPENVDQSHLSESTRTTTNLNETCSFDTSCDHLLHIWIFLAFHLNYKTPQVLKVLKLDLFLVLRNLWKETSFHQ